MMRRMWATAAASVVAGWATAQTPATSPATTNSIPQASKDAASESGVMVLRSPGQADRKVKVIKTTKLEDGRTVTEVKDVKTGETIYVSNKTAEQPKPKIVSTLAEDMTKKPTTLAESVAPSLLKMPTDVTIPSISLPAPTTLSSDVMKAPTTVVQTMTATPSDLPKAKSREIDPLTTPSKSTAAMAATSITTTIEPSAPEPSRLKKLFTKPDSKPNSPTVTVVSKPVVKETLVPAMPTMSMPAQVVTPATVVPAAIPTPMPAGAVSRAGGPIHIQLPVGVVPVEFRMKEEISPDVATLRSAMRPTQRQHAATALCDGRFGSQPEVKAILAASAKSDPAPVVRAHCIDCLSKLGYCEPDHVAYLKQCTMDSDDAVKSSAANALVKLMPKQ